MRRILAITSGRADASPMRPVVAALRERGCEVEEYCPHGLHDYSAHARAQKILSRLSVYTRGDRDIMLVLGDRYELLAACLAATISRLPIAHIHGGEASFGSFDNQIRDAVTKLSHIHFVSAEVHKKRLVSSLGEDSFRVHVVGAPGLDNVARIMTTPPDNLTATQVRARTGEGQFFVVTYHPATLGDDAGIDALIEALKKFPDYEAVFTETNADPGRLKICDALNDAGIGVSFLGNDGYLRTVLDCAAVIGNSSSGIIEAPSLGVPTVNIGHRQDGRLKGPSVIDCGETVDEIVKAIKSALDRNYYKCVYDNPYGEPGASAKIADVLATIDLDGILVKSW